MHMDERGRLANTTEPPAGSLADFSEADYRPHLEGLDLTPAHERELLRILWDISRMCIEMDLPRESWGQIVSSIFTEAAADSGDVK